MSEKKHKKSLEELCRSRVSRTAATSEMWSVSQKSSHRLFRSPSPRASCSRSRRRSENTRHSFLVSRPPSTEFIPGTSAMQHSAAHEGEKRTKKPFFPGIPSQVMTHADPAFAGTDTQPLPPINMPKGQDGSNSSKLGKDNRPFTVYGQMPFEGGVAYDIIFAANQERAAKRKLEAMKRPEEQDRHEWHNFDVSGQPMDSEHYNGKKKCGAIKKGRRAGKFSKPLAWKSPWPSQDGGGDADSDTEWDDIN